jgi:uncharacterized protein YbgA (DUF1722 family)/uncharacterized protein YbbK (DUF523 family)
MNHKLKLGISTCLLGEKVRYDGGHKLDRFLRDTLGKYVEFVPVCPETECGLSVPREAMRLVGQPDCPRLLTIKTRIDHTDRMVKWAEKRVRELEMERLSGFVFKSRSPSSGLRDVKVYNDKGVPLKKGVGIFARHFIETFPLIPVEDDGRLHDPVLRENFIQRIFVMKRWRDLLDQEMKTGKLVAFHTRHKLLIRSHSQNHYRQLGRLVAESNKLPAHEVYKTYETVLMESLTLKTTRKKNTDGLQHMMGYFKKQLSKEEKQELLELIDKYRAGHFPLIVPITLINHYVKKYDQPYLKEQYYLNPHPLELQLRNHV